ncbi:hypothetical protein HPB49_024677 [Dermacentor silvarum]|uniref:Uncharacterized protein n=1 Tax=Dermacentor silvarum TaxID=543639 RepID=A0ACB8E481_DERSI|nr:hypothetical protein HPB49_024677 [Dermacentor silvarum]
MAAHTFTNVRQLAATTVMFCTQKRVFCMRRTFCCWSQRLQESIFLGENDVFPILDPPTAVIESELETSSLVGTCEEGLLSGDAASESGLSSPCRAGTYMYQVESTAHIFRTFK